MATVAEGIETREQAASMRALGCTYGQGYFFSYPLSDTEVVAAFAADGLAAATAASAAAAIAAAPTSGQTATRARPRLRAARPSPAA